MAERLKLLQYDEKYESKLMDFLKSCLPESGRCLDLNGRHSFYKDIPNSFDTFFCLFDGEKIVGTSAVKKLTDSDCELKSLYILERYHGHGYGKMLLEKAIESARRFGYRKMYLDSLSTSTKAISLYKKFGFVDTKRYNQNERADVFMVMNLF